MEYPAEGFHNVRIEVFDRKKAFLRCFVKIDRRHVGL